MTTVISRDDVQHLAALSSLQLSDDEIAHLQTDLSTILDYIEQLSSLDTDGVEPTYQVTDLRNVWRDDSVDQAAVTREQLLALAPAQQDNSVKVPKVL